MKVLWIVNTIFPYPSKQLGIESTVFGGWLNGLAESLKHYTSIELAIASPYNGEKIMKFNDGKITYYLFPNISGIKYNKKLEKYSENIIEDFKPQILHVHGTEFAHGLAFFNINKKNIKKVVSIQGLTNCISRMYLEGIDYKDIWKSMTFRDIVKFDSLFMQKKKFKDRAKYENEIIKSSNYIIGRTDWDKYNSIAINNKVKYFNLSEIIRKEFYNYEWNIKNVEKHSIYLSQASYPIKGLHILLDAIKIVKHEYPDVKLYISGNDILNKDKIRISGYGKYIKTLIRKYDLKNNVEFIGILSEKDVIAKLLKTHVVVVPSVVENESNSLTEAHILAVPTIAAFSGGMTDRIIHKQTGFLYPYFESKICAGYIMKYFKNDELAIEYGKKAQVIAKQRNNPESNVKKLANIYNEIIRGEAI